MKNIIILNATIALCATCLIACSNDDSEYEKIEENGQFNNEEANIMRNGYGLSVIENDTAFFSPDDYRHGVTNLSERLADSVNSFSIDIFKDMSDGEGNTFISPYSIEQVLAVAANGTSGQANDEILQTFGFKGKLGDFNDANKVLANYVQRDDTLALLEVANSFWMENQMPVYRSFLSCAHNFYESNIYGIDFSAPDAGGYINNWVEAKTHGMIRDLIPNGPMNPGFNIVNAVYFQASWSMPFDEQMTDKQLFHCLDGNDAEVDMMQWKYIFNPVYFMETDKTDVISLPYHGNYRMLVCLPQEDVGLEEFIASLDEAKWKEMVDGLRAEYVDVYMPKVKVDLKVSPTAPLKRMGITTLFSSNADFTPMTTVKLGVSDILHNATLDLNEKGTVAAAATILNTTAPGDEPIDYKSLNIRQFCVNRPFFFSIYDTETNIILFIGCVKQP